MLNLESIAASGQRQLDRSRSSSITGRRDGIVN